jgi:GNAT superfamily N-acetyltransferase
MHKKDFPFAAILANTMDWNMTLEDFEFLKSLEPEGCFVLHEKSQKLGIATNISYEALGWFGNLIVTKENRKKGAGSALVTHSINYLHSQGVKTIGLFAYPYLIDFYRGFGFQQDEDFSVLHVPILGSFETEILSEIGRINFQRITRLDSQCFGGNRKRLLKSIILEPNNLSYYISERGEDLGYVASTVYDSIAWIGPLVCKESRPDIAISLFKAVISKIGGKSVYTVVPKKETALLDCFFNFGFKEKFFVTRMFLGQIPSKNCIYLPESLERG